MSYHDIPKDFKKTILGLYYKNSLKVRLNNKFTKEVKIGRGIRQGDTISPIMFLIFINPLLDGLERDRKGFKMETYKPSKKKENQNKKINTAILGFADDMILVGEGKENLKYNFKKLKNYCKYMQIYINQKKSALSNNRNENYNLKFEKLEIPFLRREESYKYLGIWLNIEMNLKKQRDICKKYADKILKYLDRRMLTSNQKVHLINSLVNPCLAYQMQVVRFKDCFLEKINKESRKVIKKKHESTCIWNGWNITPKQEIWRKRTVKLERSTKNSLCR